MQSDERCGMHNRTDDRCSLPRGHSEPCRYMMHVCDETCHPPTCPCCHPVRVRSRATMAYNPISGRTQACIVPAAPPAEPQEMTFEQFKQRFDSRRRPMSWSEERVAKLAWHTAYEAGRRSR